MRKKFMLTTALANFRPFDKSGWKTVTVKDADGKDVETVAMKDGNPVWVDADGSERTLGADTITRLNGEAAGHRKRAEEAEAKLKTFDGLDPEKARGALDTVSKLDQKKLIDAGEVEKVRESMRTEFQALIDTSNKERDEARSETNNLRLGTAFTGSKFITDKLAITPDIVQAVFGQRFKVEDGKINGYYPNGDRIISKAKIGEPADFEESLSLLVEQYPNKDTILKGGGHGGSGNNGGGGGGGQGKPRYTRSEYEKLPPAQQQKIGIEAGQGKAEIVDG